MKQLVYIFALAGIVAVACSKEIPTTQIEEPAGTYTYVINASVDSEVTKTAYENDKTFSWSKGDQISVLFHNGDDNQFFTLTALNGGGASTRFQGEITTGYTIGASDDGTKWALYPANANHVYDATAASDKVKFYIPGETDFTAAGAHYSVNMPMEARGDADDNFTFRGLTACYKFTFTGLTGVSKVKLTVENTGNGYYLSGRSPIRGSADDYYLQMYEDSGSKSISIIDKVSSGTATFYVHARCWEALKSAIVLENMDAGDNYENIIYKASSTGTGLTGIAQARIGIVPSLDVSSYGVGVPFWSSFGVNWASIDMYPSDDSKDAFPGDGGRTVEWKATSDATNIHFYFKTIASVAKTRGQWESYLVTGFDTDNDETTGSAGSYGLGDGFEARSIAFPFKNDAGSDVTFRLPTAPNSSSKIECPIGTNLATVATNGGLKGDYAYVEIRIPRDKIGSPASGATIRVRQAYGSAASAAQTITLQ